ncbi:MAG: molybdopterin molybdotransferase MoeA [Oscillospiraceae bacterium]|nr:molybdopterin molybdotransferase MoeA [Oscillospiraceae bacterium]
MLQHISYTLARDTLRDLPVRRRTEQLPLADALYRVLVEDIYTSFPTPPFDKSPFDGYTFRAADVPGTLTVSGESVTGTEHLEALMPGTAMRIFTGAPIPPGADVVVKQEDTEVRGKSIVVSAAFDPWFNVIRAGEDLAGGTKIVPAGTILSPAHLGVIASAGIGRVTVYRRPRVVLINTGTELAEPGQPRPTYGIFNSSRYSISAYLEMMGFAVDPLGIVPDDPDRITGLIRDAMAADTDLVISTGGASVGDYDYSLTAARGIQAEVLFWKVNMKPGGALLAAEKGGKLYLGLSGNPAAALMSILVVVQPYLRKLTGADIAMEELVLPLKDPLPKISSACRLLRGHLLLEDGKAFFQEHNGRGNGNLSSFEHCGLIGIIPGGSGELPAGTPIRVLRLPPDLCL